MGMQGNLRDMTVADLIQHNCQDRKTAELQIQNGNQQAVMYFKDGKVVHARFGGQVGEEVIYRVLDWSEGSFNLESGVEAPKTTIKRSWSGLLLEGAKRVDERKPMPTSSEPEPTLHIEETHMAPKLDDVLKEMSAEIDGYMASVVVGMDGIHIAHHSQTKMDPEAVSAQMALFIKLVNTSLVKLGTEPPEDNFNLHGNDLPDDADAFQSGLFLGPGSRS